MKKKERTIESYSKAVLVEFVSRYLCDLDLILLQRIELEIEYERLAARRQSLLRAAKIAADKKTTKGFLEYIVLQDKIDAIQKRISRLLEVE